jgi:L-threonylcarbamoyladenylate synthase
MKTFWPGPLTLVLPKSKVVPDVVTSGLPTVAVRMPGHPAAIGLIRALGHPIAAPSANTFGFASPTCAQDVLEDLGKKVDCVLDGGPSRIGVESTVLKIEYRDGSPGRPYAVLLRPGGVPVEEINKVIRIKKNASQKGKRPESPGLLDSHYAPRRTPLFLMNRPLAEFMKELNTAVKDRVSKKKRRLEIGLLALYPRKRIRGFGAMRFLSRKGDLYEAASNLFQEMRKLDKMGLDLLVAEAVPGHGIGLAILDRLKKAAGGKAATTELLKKF